MFRDVCQLAVELDGLVYAVETVAGQPIKEDADYSGVRVTFQASLENARVPMQIDIGFGDTVVPDAAFADYPTILDHARPRLRAYPKETVVAEKFEAMVKLGQLNSRLKDFFDLWLLSRQFEFDGRLLSEAIARTFENRKTVMSAVPIALTAAVANDPIKQTQWKGFVRKSRLAIAPAGNAGFAARIFIAFVVGTLRGWSSPAFGAAARERWSERSSGVRHGSVRRQLRDYVVGRRENRISGATFDAHSDGVCLWSR